MANQQIELNTDKGSILGDLSTPDFQGKSQQVSQKLKDVQELFKNEHDLVSHNRAWSIVPKLEDDHIKKILECAYNIRNNFEAFVTIGIGGSDLCARLYHELLNPPYYHLLSKEKRGKSPEVYFTGDTFDPRNLNGLLKSLKDRNLLDKTAFHVVSKAGRTAETFGSTLIIRKWLENIGIKEWQNQFVATTGGSAGSVLYKMNNDKPFRRMLIMPEGIGGRFSAFTSVGFLLLAVTTCSPEKPEDRLLEAINGIQYADDIFNLPYDHEQNIGYRLAEWLHLAEATGKSIMEFYDYADQRFLADWFVQLYDESVQERGQGLTVRPLRGPTCNHSALNGIMNGPKDKVVLFLQWNDLDGSSEMEIPAYDDVKDPELAELSGLKLSELQVASYGGTAEDFTEKGVPNITLNIPKRDVASVNALMRILMDTTAVKGRLQDLHLDSSGTVDFKKELTYLQDGVEGYKKKTRKLAAEIKARGKIMIIDVINNWVTQPILSPNEFQNQLQQFIKGYIPPLEVPQTADEWTKKSDELRQEILNKVVYRGVPKEWYEGMPQIVWGDTIETDKGYVIRKLRYEALPGLWIPSLLYEPTKMDGKIPSVLNVNGHVGPPGKTQDYEQIRCINLAKRGVLALHPEWLVFGELSSEDFKHNRLVYLDLCGACGVSVFFLAIKRGIDVLVMHQNADTEKIAMTGLSGGGWQTIFLSSLDTRVTASAPNAGYIGLDYRADFIEDTGDVEQNPNDLLTIADYSHLTAMLAPNPTQLIYNEKDDCCFQTHRARPSVYEPIIPFFELFGKADNLALHNNTVPGTHNYDKDNREQLYKFINKYFLAGSNTVDSEIPSDDEVLPYDDLIVGILDDNANFYTLAMEMMRDFPKNRPPKGNISQWQKDGRDTLRNILKNKPMTAQGNKIAEVSEGNLKSKQYKVSVNGFTIPLVAISNSEKDNNSIKLIFADKGKSTLIEQVKSEVEKGSTVIVLDPIFMGECMPVKGPVWQYTQMVSTIGERTLGLQAGQIGAIIDWACQEFKCDKVSLYGIGWNASLVAILACALSNERIESVSVKDHLPSLKILIENHLDYETHPVFFCFGLLEQFDVEEFIALCLPVTVNIV